jgi:hypothetical protein
MESRNKRQPTPWTANTAKRSLEYSLEPLPTDNVRVQNGALAKDGHVRDRPKEDG